MLKKEQVIINRFMRSAKKVEGSQGYHNMEYEGRMYHVFFTPYSIFATTDDVAGYECLDGEGMENGIARWLNKFAFHDNREMKSGDYSEILVDRDSVKMRKDINKANKAKISWVFQADSGEKLCIDPQYLLDLLDLVKTDSLFVNMSEWKSGTKYRNGIFFENDNKSRIAMLLPVISQADGDHVDEDSSYCPKLIGVFVAA